LFSGRLIKEVIGMTYAIKPVEITQKKEHLEVYINGRFYCSADNWREAETEIQNYVSERNGRYENKSTM
jgi:hypothetical protein